MANPQKDGTSKKSTTIWIDDNKISLRYVLEQAEHLERLNQVEAEEQSEIKPTTKHNNDNPDEETDA